LMLLPISDEVPFFLKRIPHPRTPELRQFGIIEHVRHDQEQRATPRTTPLFPAGEVPLTVRTVVALRPVSQGILPKYVAYPQAHNTTTWTFRAGSFTLCCFCCATCSRATSLLSSKCALQSIGKENTGVRIRIAVVQGA